MSRKLKKINNKKLIYSQNNLLTNLFINKIMKHGKKELATNILTIVNKTLTSKLQQNFTFILETAIRNVAPKIILKSRRIGGSNIQLPITITPLKSIKLGINFILLAAKNSTIHKKFTLKLTNELEEAFLNKGTAVKKKEQVHKLAELNKIFIKKF